MAGICFTLSVPSTSSCTEPNVLHGLQSIDNLQSLTSQEHLRLRGGGRAGHKKSDGSKRNRSEGTAAKGGTANDAQLEEDIDANPSRMSQNKEPQEPTLIPHHFAVNDRIEVRPLWQGRHVKGCT